MDDRTILKACAMRLDGMSWDAISQLLHYDRVHLSRTVGRALRRDRDRKEGPDHV